MHGTNRLQCQTDLKFPNVSGRAVDGISWTQHRCRVGVTVQIRLRATAAQCFCALKYVHLTFKVKIQAEGYNWISLVFSKTELKRGNTDSRQDFSFQFSTPESCLLFSRACAFPTRSLLSSWERRLKVSQKRCMHAPSYDEYSPYSNKTFRIIPSLHFPHFLLVPLSLFWHVSSSCWLFLLRLWQLFRR